MSKARLWLVEQAKAALSKARSPTNPFSKLRKHIDTLGDDHDEVAELEAVALLKMMTAVTLLLSKIEDQSKSWKKDTYARAAEEVEAHLEQFDNLLDKAEEICEILSTLAKRDKHMKVAWG